MSQEDEGNATRINTLSYLHINLSLSFSLHPTLQHLQEVTIGDGGINESSF